jgi:uncharacterized protein YihD (DUF1040 family)
MVKYNTIEEIYEAIEFSSAYPDVARDIIISLSKIISKLEQEIRITDKDYEEGFRCTLIKN